MIGTYFKTAFRNMKKHLSYAIINVIGLALGLTVCFLIIIWVIDELSYDDFHGNGDRIFRVVLEQNLNENRSYIAATPGALGEELAAVYPEIESYCRLDNKGGWQFRYGEGEFIVGESALVDPGFFDFFSFEWISGSIEKAFSSPRNIILTQEYSRKLFGEIDPLGKTIEMKVLGNFTVAGIMEDVDRSHLELDFILPFEFLGKLGIEIPPLERSNLEYMTYLKLRENIDPVEFSTKIRHFLDGKIGQGIFSLILQPLPDIYLKGRCGYDSALTSEIKYVYIFSFIAFMVLLIASINFINLATARSMVRAKEIGIRKVAGAYRSHLIIQFLGESVITAFLAMLFALILVELLLPGFNTISGKNIGINTILVSGFWLWSLGLVLVTGLVAGLYPSLYLTSFHPIEVLKGQLTQGSKGFFSRQFLVTGQFAVSIILMIIALTISAQINYITKKDLGFDRELLAHVRITRSMRDNMDLLKERISNLPGVSGISAVAQIPAGGNSSTPVLDWDGNNGEEMFRIFISWTDPGFLETFGVKLISGENFADLETTEVPSYVLVNETALKEMDIEQPLGKRLLISARYYEIRGVIEDFNINTLHQDMAPLALIHDSNRARHLFVRLTPVALPEIIKNLNKVVKEIDSTAIESFQIFDETLATRYETESRTSRIVSYFTILAIFISGLGLFGLAAYASEQRLHEICIRKILGAGSTRLLLFLSGDFMRWILLANIIAWPLAWYIGNKWLQNFAFRMEFNFLNMIYAGLISVLIAIVTIISKTLTTVNRNPVNVLRYE